MREDYKLYSMLVSMYSGKVRAYMNYKRLNYVDKSADIFDMSFRIKSKTGERVLPVVETRSGEWLQDTTIIIETLEERHPEPSIAVPTPIQYAASLLLECWGDEYWLPVAMHYRWSYGENHTFIQDEVSKSTVPFAARTLGRYVAKKATDRLAKAAPIIGFIPEQHDMLEAWTERILDLLETHFNEHDYLFGGRPTIADFSLLASFFGHLDRDPAPKRILMSKRPKLAAWVERTHSGYGAQGDLLPGDAVPETLSPILQCMFTEFFPMVASYRDVLLAHVNEHRLGPGDPVPRFLKPASFPMGNHTFKRSAMPYTLWMMQRARNKCLAVDAASQGKVEDWLTKTFGTGITSMDFGPTLERSGLSTKIAKTTENS
ncbi:MAG: glutathione S-transferase family protein [Pseudomonadota bacterium]